MFSIFKNINTILTNQMYIIGNQLDQKKALDIIVNQQEALLNKVGELQGHIHTHPLRVRAATKAALEQAEQNETGTFAEELAVSGE
ncbi:MAG: hypothetical protein ACJ788_00120 [Ktedonobacteraceae bacterium]